MKIIVIISMLYSEVRYISYIDNMKECISYKEVLENTKKNKPQYSYKCVEIDLESGS